MVVAVELDFGDSELEGFCPHLSPFRTPRASPAQVAISWVRQQPGPVIPLIAARTEEQFRDNLAAIDVNLGQEHLDRLDALSRPTLGFPADVMRDASVVAGVYGSAN
jgi:diketogulonate reductase-like aldo/keto reductase